MHIVFWSPAWPLEKYQNGIITYVHWMRRELERRGHRVSIFTNELDPSVTDPRVHKVKRSLRYRVLRRIKRSRVATDAEVFEWSTEIASAIKKLHRREPIDVIEFEESFGWFAEIAKRTLLPVAVKLHGPAFLTMVGGALDTPFGREKVEREGNALRAVSTIIAPSQSTLDRTIERYSLRPRLTAHIVNPMTADSDTPLWSLESCDRNTILFVGRFDFPKGADVMLQAFLRILSAGRRSKLIFVGPDIGLIGPDGRQTQFDAYRNSVFPMELRSQIDFRGRMSNREVAKLRTEAMVTVVASRWENQTYTLLEAMIQGCPVVSTDAGGCPESVIDGKTGLLAKSENATDFAEKINSILDSPQAAAEMGKAARRHVLDLHSASRVATESLAIYEAVIADCRR
jgi:glycosyltransferase involved in cell wall biosynthesis